MLQIAITNLDCAMPMVQAGSEEESFDSLLPTIREKLDLPDYPASDLLRMILAENVRMIQQLTTDPPDGKASYRMRVFRVRAMIFRTLAQCLRQREELRKKEDLLRFDGPVISHIFDALLDCFEKTVEETLGKRDPSAARNILFQFKDKVAMRERELQRQVDKMLRTYSCSKA